MKIVGGAMGIAALVLCIIFCHDGYGLFSGIVYGISMILLYTMSAIYHGLSPKLKAKKVFQIMDHCSIFVLIAGTYTPVLLCSIREVDAKWAWILFAVIWIMTVIGITLNAIDIKKYQSLTTSSRNEWYLVTCFRRTCLYNWCYFLCITK